jgi:hypothetical protein
MPVDPSFCLLAILLHLHEEFLSLSPGKCSFKYYQWYARLAPEEQVWLPSKIPQLAIRI